MTLARRVVLSSLAVAFPAALVTTAVVEWRRSRDARVYLERVARAHLTDVVRDACTADSNWFLAGPRTGRPALADRQLPDADVKLARPSTAELPFELFAYDDMLAPTSTAGPRFPNEFRNAIRGSPPSPEAVGRYVSAAGSGWQMALRTGWNEGPCAVLLFRLQPRPAIWAERLALFLGSAALTFVSALAAFWPTVRRVRRLSREATQAARADFETIAPDNAKDEISTMAFVFNDAAKEVHVRRAEIGDRVEALRRLTASVATDVADPLRELGARADDPAISRQLFGAERTLRNLAAAATLRMQNDSLPAQPTDVAALVRGVVTRYEPLARQASIALDLVAPASLTASVHGELTTLAVDNLIDNAVRYTPAGGHVTVRLEARPGAEAFCLSVLNDAPAMSEELFKGLTTLRRFRGDEGRNRRPNAPGLGLAVSREIADRSGLQLDFRRPAPGRLEALITAGHPPTRG